MNLYIYDIINAITEICGLPEIGSSGQFKWACGPRPVGTIEMNVVPGGFVAIDITDAFRISTHEDKDWHISGYDGLTDPLNQKLMGSIIFIGKFNFNKRAINKIPRHLVVEQIKTMAMIVKNTMPEPEI